MPLTFPLSAADFFGGLRVASASFDAPEVLQLSQTAGGEVLTADLGARLWGGSVRLVTATNRDQAAVRARLSVLRQAGRSFMVFDPAIDGPAADEGGLMLRASSPVIASLAANNREMGIGGLPARYILTPGDYLSFTYGSNPVRYALHQVVTGAVASSAGLMQGIEVTPHIRPGAATGAAVELVQPFCKAVIVPGSVEIPEGAPYISDGPSFRFMQTLR